MATARQDGATHFVRFVDLEASVVLASSRMTRRQYTWWSTLSFCPDPAAALLVAKETKG